MGAGRGVRHENVEEDELSEPMRTRITAEETSYDRAGFSMIMRGTCLALDGRGCRRKAIIGNEILG